MMIRLWLVFLNSEKGPCRALLLPLVEKIIGADAPRKLLDLGARVFVALVLLDAQHILVVPLPA